MCGFLSLWVYNKVNYSSHDASSRFTFLFIICVLDYVFTLLPDWAESSCCSLCKVDGDALVSLILKPKHLPVCVCVCVMRCHGDSNIKRCPADFHIIKRETMLMLINPFVVVLKTCEKREREERTDAPSGLWDQKSLTEDFLHQTCLNW